MKKGFILLFLTILLALLQLKMVLWSGYAPDLLLMGLIALSGGIPIINLLILTLCGFLVVAGPVISVELITILVIVSFSHFLRLFVLGHSPLLSPLLASLGVSLFYLGTVGIAFFTAPLFLFEILVMSLLVSICVHGFLVYI